jgi:hypothetical protein
MNAITEIQTEAVLSTIAPPLMSEEFELDAITNDYSCKMNGKTILTFVYTEKTGCWTRLDKVPGVVILSQAAFIDRSQGYARSHDRHSTTRVEIELSEGDYVADMNRGGVRATGVWKVARVGDELDLKRIEYKSVRLENGNWGIKIPNQAAPRDPILLPSIRG